jgi:two-component system LytT family response regulator
MEHLNILIVEDEFDQAQRYKDILEFSGFNVVDIITNYRDAMAFILNDPEYEQTVDLLILDILLDGRPEGLNIAEAIDAMPNKQKPFIFVTNSTERDIFERAKLTKSYAYLVKPVNELELVYSIEQAIERFYEQPNALSTEDENAVISNEYLFIKKGNSLKKVHITDIVYIEVEEKYCNIVTAKEKFVILISLIKILELLNSDRFCRTHRNFIVNTDKIVEIVPRDNLIILEGGFKATLSDKYKDLIKKIRTLR